MGTVIADTSFLLVLTEIRRLDILASRSPIWVSNSVYREHRTNASPKTQDYLDRCIEEGLVEIRNPGVAAEADFLKLKYRALSYVDAEGVAWAVHEQAFLLCEDDAMLDAADAEGVDWVDLCDMLKACIDGGVLTKDDARRVGYAIELDADHQLPARCRAELGLE